MNAFLVASTSGEITAITGKVGELVEGGTSWVGTFLDEIVSNPILTIFCIALPLVGLGVGLLKRLLSVKG